MTQYKIVTDYKQEQLELTIARYLKEGWTLVGGLSMVWVVGNEDYGKPMALFGQSLAMGV
jgi:hypothetical protein